MLLYALECCSSKSVTTTSSLLPCIPALPAEAGKKFPMKRSALGKSKYYRKTVISFTEEFQAFPFDHTALRYAVVLIWGYYPPTKVLSNECSSGIFFQICMLGLAHSIFATFTALAVKK